MHSVAITTPPARFPLFAAASFSSRPAERSRLKAVHGVSVEANARDRRTRFRSKRIDFLSRLLRYNLFKPEPVPLVSLLYNLQLAAAAFGGSCREFCYRLLARKFYLSSWYFCRWFPFDAKDDLLRVMEFWISLHYEHFRELIWEFLFNTWNL